MLLTKDKKYIIITPPKTGNKTIIPFFAKFGTIELSPDAHDSCIPEEYRSVSIPVLCIAEPYNRCISMWWWSCMAPERDQKCHLYGCSFVRYMHRLIWFRDHLDEKHNTQDVYMNLSQYADKLAKQCNKEPLVIRKEFMADDIGKLNIDCNGIKASTESQRPHVPAIKFLSGMEEELVWEYCQEDFFKFGYQRLPRSAEKMRNWG